MKNMKIWTFELLYMLLYNVVKDKSQEGALWFIKFPCTILHNWMALFDAEQR